MFGGDDQNNNTAADNSQPTDSAAAPADDQNNTPAPVFNAPTDDAGGDVPAPQAPTDDMLSNDHAAGDDLLNLKQQALQQLSPLVGHLDQSPEEKFRTTMMMIQASDNAALLKDAYEAANAITDDKAKAQALLDVINEINYFTQNHDNQ